MTHPKKVILLPSGVSAAETTDLAQSFGQLCDGHDIASVAAAIYGVIAVDSDLRRAFARHSRFITAEAACDPNVAKIHSDAHPMPAYALIVAGMLVAARMIAQRVPVEDVERMAQDQHIVTMILDSGAHPDASFEGPEFHAMVVDLVQRARQRLQRWAQT